ncbi:MAG: epoxyqueuosine reductase QueH, partial [Spirochaetaceae bacterium]|nr:epoxyqueuosine reductase QueH [Spirochaetaceae bacterium]
FDFFTTTLSISPHKDSEKINTIGKILSQESTLPQFLYADFKKKNGFKRSLELSQEYNLYRQDYCGCFYSYTQSKNTQSNYTSENRI